MDKKMTLYVPKGLEGTHEVNGIKDSFKNIRIPHEVKIISKEEEEELKFNILIPLAVSKRIKIKQTHKTKSLYPQLVIFEGEKPVTFYPQSHGKENIKIQEALNEPGLI